MLKFLIALGIVLAPFATSSEFNVDINVSVHFILSRVFTKINGFFISKVNDFKKFAKEYLNLDFVQQSNSNRLEQMC